MVWDFSLKKGISRDVLVDYDPIVDLDAPKKGVREWWKRPSWRKYLVNMGLEVRSPTRTFFGWWVILNSGVWILGASWKKQKIRDRYFSLKDTLAWVVIPLILNTNGSVWAERLFSLTVTSEENHRKKGELRWKREIPSTHTRYPKKRREFYQRKVLRTCSV